MCLFCFIDSKTDGVYSILKSKSIANKLKLIDSNDIDNVFQCYVHDFVMYSCGSSEYNEDSKVFILKECGIIVMVCCVFHNR